VAHAAGVRLTLVAGLSESGHSRSTNFSMSRWLGCPLSRDGRVNMAMSNFVI
jgi:hypothetical protein